MQTDQLSKNIKARFDHQQARSILREKYQAKMIFTYNGGMWQASPELIMLCSVCAGTVVFEDYYNTPISVESNELCMLAKQRWQEQMNAWQVEYQEISKNR